MFQMFQNIELRLILYLSQKVRVRSARDVLVILYQLKQCYMLQKRRIMLFVLVKANMSQSSASRHIYIKLPI
jgi:hypothetical protein